MGSSGRIDFLVAPLGLRAQDVRDTAIGVVGAIPAGDLPVWVMHPERSMESRVYNVQILGHDDEHALTQLRAPIEIARVCSRQLLGDESVPERDRVRAVLRLNERILRKCLEDLHFLGIYRDHGVDPSPPCWLMTSACQTRSAGAVPADAQSARAATESRTTDLTGAVPIVPRMRTTANSTDVDFYVFRAALAGFRG